MSCHIRPQLCPAKTQYEILLKIFDTHALPSSVLITEVDSRVLNEDTYYMMHIIAHLSRDQHLFFCLHFYICYHFSKYLLK